MKRLGIDIGGSGIKGAPVDIQTGELAGQRFRIPTPQPATPEAVAGCVAEIVSHFDVGGTVGCAFPAAVQHGVARTAANIDDAWLGTNVEDCLKRATGRETVVVNDADAAGLAEIRFGAGRDKKGIVFMVTLGTGIGTAIFVEGKLFPNTELGHLLLKGMEAEHYASDLVRKKEELSWKKWGGRVKRYLNRLEELFFPDLFIVGGGVSKKHEKFFDYIKIETPLVAAELRNEAGIVGAGCATDRT